MDIVCFAVSSFHSAYPIVSCYIPNVFIITFIFYYKFFY
jgi:hypothetical protein